jgi:hypothetical protein
MSESLRDKGSAVERKWTGWSEGLRSIALLWFLVSPRNQAEVPGPVCRGSRKAFRETLGRKGGARSSSSSEERDIVEQRGVSPPEQDDRYAQECAIEMQGVAGRNVHNVVTTLLSACAGGGAKEREACVCGDRPVGLYEDVFVLVVG